MRNYEFRNLINSFVFFHLKGCAFAAEPLSLHGGLEIMLRGCFQRSHEFGTFIEISTSNCPKYVRASCTCAIYVHAIYVRVMCVLCVCYMRARCVLCACYECAMCVLGACYVCVPCAC